MNGNKCAFDTDAKGMDGATDCLLANILPTPPALKISCPFSAFDTDLKSTASYINFEEFFKVCVKVEEASWLLTERQRIS